VGNCQPQLDGVKSYVGFEQRCAVRNDRNSDVMVFTQRDLPAKNDQILCTQFQSVKQAIGGFGR